MQNPDLDIKISGCLLKLMTTEGPRQFQFSFECTKCPKGKFNYEHPHYRHLHHLNHRIIIILTIICRRNWSPSSRVSTQWRCAPKSWPWGSSCIQTLISGRVGVRIKLHTRGCCKYGQPSEQCTWNDIKHLTPNNKLVLIIFDSGTLGTSWTSW